MPNLLRFGAIFRAFAFPAPLYLPSSLFTLFPTSPLSHFTPPLPFPKEVNKKPTYRGQNALVVIKHTNAIPTAKNYIVFICTSV